VPRRPAIPRKKPPAFKLPRYIAVEGPIRVGKSSLARILAERMHARRILDCDEENPFLADFYAEKQGAAFAAQMYFLNERSQRLLEAFAAQPPARWWPISSLRKTKSSPL
jgi:deoxyadenosine/deoxycytidine kinase